MARCRAAAAHASPPPHPPPPPPRYGKRRGLLLRRLRCVPSNRLTMAMLLAAENGAPELAVPWKPGPNLMRGGRRCRRRRRRRRCPAHAARNPRAGLIQRSPTMQCTPWPSHRWQCTASAAEPPPPSPPPPPLPRPSPRRAVPPHASPLLARHQCVHFLQDARCGNSPHGGAAQQRRQSAGTDTTPAARSGRRIRGGGLRMAPGRDGTVM